MIQILIWALGGEVVLTAVTAELFQVNSGVPREVPHLSYGIDEAVAAEYGILERLSREEVPTQRQAFCAVDVHSPEAQEVDNVDRVPNPLHHAQRLRVVHMRVLPAHFQVFPCAHHALAVDLGVLHSLHLHTDVPADHMLGGHPVLAILPLRVTHLQ